MNQMRYNYSLIVDFSGFTLKAMMLNGGSSNTV